MLVGPNNFTAPPVGFNHQWVRKNRSKTTRMVAKYARDHLGVIHNCPYQRLMNAVTLGLAIIEAAWLLHARLNREALGGATR